MSHGKGKGGLCEKYFLKKEGIQDRCEPDCTYTKSTYSLIIQDTGVHVTNLVKVHDSEGNKFTFYDSSSFCKIGRTESMYFHNPLRKRI